MSWQWKSIGAVWLLAVVCAVLTGIFSARGQEIVWIGLSLAGCTLATLCVQLATGRKDGYVNRVTSSLVGAVVVLALATGYFAVLGLG
ncbi:hypothetical protein [Cryobacterium tagatosivorans]|uniref:Uncharacterized protein n=1 Tax=Cryobacterium tagatosivorans TaxID=1259199 RepID=A0A4R8UDB0_9MICO|nr:hypothetical protein [Cryobacterium tagatosivorans]TFB48869.1 hypothetical protein E3O23_12435 [Cryobacterium tagatosivorans]